MEALSKAIETHYIQTRPDKKALLAQQTIFNYIKKCSRILQQSESNALDPSRVLPHISASFIESTTWNVFIFGSQSDGTSSPSSDIDIAIHLNFKNTRRDKERLLLKLSRIISKNDPQKSLLVKCILQARYPIIKMYDIKSHDHMNVSIADDYCHARTELIKSYIAHHTSIWKKVLKSDECIHKLIVFVKQWSKIRGINGAYSGYINSFGFVVLVIKFIQWFEVNKLQGKKQWNLGEILYEFYAFYISKFDWNSHCVSINQRFSFEDEFKEQIFDYKLDPYCDMQVIDPVNVKNNITQSVGRDQAQHIKYEFIRSVSIIERNKEGLFDMMCDTQQSERESVEGCSIKYDIYGMPDLYYESLDGSATGGDARYQYDRSTKWSLTPVVRVMTQSKSSFSM